MIVTNNTKSGMSYVGYLFHPVRQALASPLGVLVPVVLIIPAIATRYSKNPLLNIELSNWFIGSGLTIFLIFLCLWDVPREIYCCLISWAKNPVGRLVRCRATGSVGTVISVSSSGPVDKIIYNIMIDEAIHEFSAKQFEFVEEESK